MTFFFKIIIQDPSINNNSPLQHEGGALSFLSNVLPDISKLEIFSASSNFWFNELNATAIGL